MAEWLAAGAPSLTGVTWLGSAFHPGRESATGAASPKFDSTQDIDFNHEAELTHSGDFLLATDERGGGVAPPGASCSTATDVKVGNGGVHAYRTANLLRRKPTSAEDAHNSYAAKPGGGKAIYRAPVRNKAQAALCTAHVFQQIPGQNRIFMGWYSQGTQVLDYEERDDGTIDVKEAAYFIPTNANEWVSHVFKVERNGDGSFTYYGAASDFAVGDGGRNTIDVYKVTLPAPPAPRRLLPGVGSGFKPPSCLARRVVVGPRNIGRLALGQSRARTAKRAQPLGTFSRRTRVLRYCVKGSSVFRGAAVFDGRGKLRVAGTNAKGHTRRRVGRGTSARVLRQRFGRRLAATVEQPVHREGPEGESQQGRVRHEGRQGALRRAGRPQAGEEPRPRCADTCGWPSSDRRRAWDSFAAVRRKVVTLGVLLAVLGAGSALVVLLGDGGGSNGEALLKVEQAVTPDGGVEILVTVPTDINVAETARGQTTVIFECLRLRRAGGDPVAAGVAARERRQPAGAARAPAGDAGGGQRAVDVPLPRHRPEARGPGRPRPLALGANAGACACASWRPGGPGPAGRFDRRRARPARSPARSSGRRPASRRPARPAA